MDLFDRGLIRLMLQTHLSQAEITLGRIEYLESLLLWFYLPIAISFHCPSLFLRPPKFWLVVEAFKCFVFLTLTPNITDICRKFHNTTVENVTSSRVEKDVLFRAQVESIHAFEVRHREVHRQHPS